MIPSPEAGDFDCCLSLCAKIACVKHTARVIVIWKLLGLFDGSSIDVCVCVCVSMCFTTA